ncbi:MAG: TraR/DksA C4-type zinc finger protein [Candidatus Pacebacteria bacterium]|nr:TraR/DksA C4-type zinc finger protein [Candidatus Paceibacterota bacterium]
MDKKSWKDFCEKQKEKMQAKVAILKTEIADYDQGSDHEYIFIFERATYKVKKINQALTKMDRGDYGRCVSCRQMIPEQRLIILPEVDHCFACAKKT